MNPASDTHARSVVKAVTWKFVAFCITLLTSYIFTRDFKLAGQITGLAALIGIVAYYFHERIWNIITWGRKF